jgi:hypothetical protein
MRMGVLAIGLIVLFAGFVLLSVSRTSVTKTDENLVPIATGVRDVPEISGVNLTKDERFVVRYSGGGKNYNPEDLIINIYDPSGNLTTVLFQSQRQKGMIANYTGSYKIQMGAPGLIDPSSPFIMMIDEIEEITYSEYPNTYLHPYGLGVAAIGAGISAWGAITSKRKTTRARNRTRKQ